jgi:hypothetical protein
MFHGHEQLVEVLSLHDWKGCHGGGQSARRPSPGGMNLNAMIHTGGVHRVALSQIWNLTKKTILFARKQLNSGHF